jgi:hypothetical protein
MENEVYQKNINFIFGLKDFRTPENPTIYDEIANLDGIHLHNRLIFEFSIRNKQNKKYIDKVLSFYNRYKLNIDTFCAEVINNQICWISLKFDIIENDYGQYIFNNKTLFYKLRTYLEYIEFLPFDCYEADSNYIHPLINKEIFTVMNKIYKTENIIINKTNETQLEYKIDDNITEYIGEKGFNLRLENNDVGNFVLGNHYLNNTPDFFHHRTDITPKIKAPEINKNFISKNVSFNINLGLNDKDIKLIIDDLYKKIDEIRNNHKEAIMKYESILKLNALNVDDYFLKEKKNITYAKLLYAYDQNIMYNKEFITKNIKDLINDQLVRQTNGLNKNELLFSLIPDKKNTIFQKYVFYMALKNKVVYSSTHETLKKELSKIYNLIQKKLYLQLI